MSIFIIGQKVWAPKVTGAPKFFTTNHVYELLDAVEEDEGGPEGYNLLGKEDGIVFAEKGTIRHLSEVDICKQCGSDKIQFPMWVDNLQVVQGSCEGLDPFCPECNETMTRSFHCTLDEYLKYQEEQRIYEENAMRANED